MSKIKFTLGLIALILGNTLMLINILRSGFGDFRAEVSMGALTILLLVVVYYGVNWLKWIAGAIYILLSISGAIAVIDGDHVSYAAVSICFAVAASIVFTAKVSNATTAPLNIQTLDEDLISSTPEVLTPDPSEYPLLVARIKSTLIDNLLVFSSLLIVMIATQGLENSTSIKIVMGFGLGLLYEPVLTAYSATVGQRIMGIRVRSSSDVNKRISALQGVIRLLIKLTLGWISFLTVHSNVKRRALHDLISGSVMIKKQEQIVSA